MEGKALDSHGFTSADIDQYQPIVLEHLLLLNQHIKEQISTTWNQKASSNAW